MRSGMALGGIGAGYFELRKDGRFYDWNIANNFPKETGPRFVLPDDEREDRMAANLFFEVRYQVEDGPPRVKLLQMSDSLYEGAEMGIAYSFPWMKAVQEIEYSARFPLATLTFRDDEMPFSLTLQAWSSFIPHDVKNSSLPLVFFDFEVIATEEKPVEVTLLMSARNFAGYETDDRFYTTVPATDGGRLTVTMGCGGMDVKASSYGEIALGSVGQPASYYAGWAHRHPYYEQVLRQPVLPDLDDTNGRGSARTPMPDWLPDTSGRNRVDPLSGRLKVHDADLFSTVAGTFTLRAKGARARHGFRYAWYFPNLYNAASFRVQGDRVEGHFYSNFFASAAQVMRYGFKEGAELKRRSVFFLESFFASDAELFLLEQVNSHLNTFFTSGRLVRDGSFGILEGLAKTFSWGPIATIDVMLYGTAPIVALFPELQQSTMRCHARVQLASGEIEHGLQKDFGQGEDNTANVSHRIDLPGQFAIMVMRDYFWTNDKTYLRELFPSVRRAIEYVLRERSGGEGKMPVTHGIETSYDNFPMSEYASYLLSQWICALQSAAEGAEVLGEGSTAARYGSLAEETGKRMEISLWNGSFYRLYAEVGNNSSDPDGEGCLTDQIVGHWAARSSGLRPVLPSHRVQQALRSILKRNFRTGFGLKNCSFRADGELSDVDRSIWNDQANTCWSGVELAFAALLIYEGLYAEGMEIVKTVDDRYRANGLYWNHQEFGGHYFRPMSSWSLVNAVLGFSMHCGRMIFDPKPRNSDLRLFFVTPSATAWYTRRGPSVKIECLTGKMVFQEIWLGGISVRSARMNREGRTASVNMIDCLQQFHFESPQTLVAGDVMEFS